MQVIKFKLLILIVLIGTDAIAQKAKRIVSLAPSITKNIYYLDAQSELVGCTNYCTEALNDNIEIVATAIQVNIEKVITLKPDLVLVTTITSPETIAMLRKFNIKVEVFPTPDSFSAICEQFIRMGNLVGKSETAFEIASKSKKRVEQLSTKHPINNNKNIFFQIGAKPLFTVLPNTFMNDYITFCGARNIAEEMKIGSITRESVITKNPDVILVVTMGITGEEEKKMWENYKGMSAADRDKIFIIDAEKACSPTPVTFVETLETIVNLLNQNP